MRSSRACSPASRVSATPFPRRTVGRSVARDGRQSHFVTAVIQHQFEATDRTPVDDAGHRSEFVGLLVDRRRTGRALESHQRRAYDSGASLSLDKKV